MKIDIPSFLLGYGAGLGTALVGQRLRPLLVELATVLYRFADSVAAHAAVRQEDLEDLLAEARARARRRPGASHKQAQA